MTANQLIEALQKLPPDQRELPVLTQDGMDPSDLGLVQSLQVGDHSYFTEGDWFLDSPSITLLAYKKSD